MVEVEKAVSDSIKLIRNTKGYNWEIRILSLDVDLISKINNDMFQRFGDNAPYHNDDKV